MFALLYYIAPNVRQPRFPLDAQRCPGVLLWVAASAGLGVYINPPRVLRRDTTSALASVIIFLVWLWITNVALLLGAEFEAARARARAGSGLPAHDRIAPPREPAT